MLPSHHAAGAALAVLPLSRRGWSPLAIANVESIRDYVALDSPVYADLVVRRIMSSVDRLAVFPESGRVVPEVGRPEIREVVMRPYRVVYRLLNDGVEIATVFHAARLFRGIEG